MTQRAVTHGLRDTVHTREMGLARRNTQAALSQGRGSGHLVSSPRSAARWWEHCGPTPGL